MSIRAAADNIEGAREGLTYSFAGTAHSQNFVYISAISPLVIVKFTTVASGCGRWLSLQPVASVPTASAAAEDVHV